MVIIAWLEPLAQSPSDGINSLRSTENYLRVRSDKLYFPLFQRNGGNSAVKTVSNYLFGRDVVGAFGAVAKTRGKATEGWHSKYCRYSNTLCKLHSFSEPL